jgi:hypothetical protein
MTDKTNPDQAPSDDDVQGHGIEEDDAADVAESFTVTGCCMGVD